MILDTGILTVYKKVNTAENGGMPTYVYYKTVRQYYGTKTVGMSRFWAAQQSNAQIDLLVETREMEAYSGDVAYLQPNKRNSPSGWFTILQAQQVTDDLQQTATDLTLRRIDKLEFPIQEGEE